MRFARRAAALIAAPMILGLLAAPAGAAVTLGTPSLAVSEYAEFNGAVAAFTTDDPFPLASHYTATIDWGDGTATTATISGSGSASGGTFTVSGNHIYADGGAWVLKVTLHDSTDSSKAEATGTATVVDAPLAATAPAGLTLPEGGASAATLAHFTDADTGPVPPPSHYTATVSWGDGSANSPATIVGLGGEQGYDVSATPHAYAEEGSFTLTVTIEDLGGAHTSVSIPVSVLDLPLAATPVATLGVGGFGNASFAGALASFTDADPGAQIGDYTALILWGDGSASDGTIGVASPGVFAVDGAHIYTQSGTYTVKILFRDVGGQSALTQLSLAVAVTPAVTLPQPLPLILRCVVPNLKGKSQAAAGLALARSHCKLGKVTKSRRLEHGHGKPARPLVVVGQSPAAGADDPAGTAVSLHLAPAPKAKSKPHR
jgi:hypothetical protein